MTAKKVTTGPLKVLSAILILGLGALTGVAVDRLALVDPPGLGLVLTGMLFAGCLLLVRRPRRRESMLLGFAAAAIVVWVMIRDADFLVTIDIFAATLLAGAAISAEVYDTRMWLWRLREHVGAWIDQLLAMVNGPSHALAIALRGRDQLRFEPAMPYLRGAVIALPVLIVFGLLLSGADAVFGDFLGGLVPDIEIDWNDETVWHLIAVFFFGWVAAGMLTFAVQPSRVGSARRSARQTALPSTQRSGEDAANSGDATVPATAPATSAGKSAAGHVEAIVVLGSVCALLALFVGFQFAFLFRGEAQIDVPGVTYAEYARSGFFQLLWVSVLVVGLIWLALGKVGESPPDRARIALRAIATTMILLTGVILVSALMRLGLYIDAYGLTRLRLGSRLFTYLVAVVLAILLVQVYWRRRHIFIGGVAIAGFVFLFALNAINPDARIAEHNLARAAGEPKPNTDFMWDLGADAAPAYLSYRRALSAEQRDAGSAATFDPVCAMFDRDESWRSWNLGRQRAHSAIENAIPNARERSLDCSRGTSGGLD